MACSMLRGSQGVVLATAMAVSGTVILLAFGIQKSTQVLIPHSSSQVLTLRSCISSSDGKKKKKKKRVQFAEDVAEPSGNSEEFRRRRQHGSSSANSSSAPPNRVALYDGILRDRVVHRCSLSSY